MRVAVVMGSDSDWPVMQKAVEILQEFGVEHAVTIASAHRTPEKLARFVRAEEEAGAAVFIAGAGAAAHLPGVVASLTEKPVIGVPLAASLGGLDALLAIVQMPSGMPVATVAIGGAKNAALLAVQIGAVRDENLAAAFHAYRQRQAAGVEEKDERLQRERKA
ncbi:MAG: 5-(carboxyamino)imidazole ribonucleotide mutase [Veillonellaceae bacterium]|nr:5-(carboxyamino)imidazole ribonucleotide mutase [Veillonellaceae bacterium]